MKKLSEERMIRSGSLLLGLTALAAVLGGCPPGPENSPQILAVVGDTRITLADVEGSVATTLAELERQRQGVIQRGLDRLVAETLVGLEATEQRLSPEELLAQKVDGKAGEVSDDEVDAFYEANKQTIDRGNEQVAEHVRPFLQSQRRERIYREFISGLREKYGVEIHPESLGSPAEGR